MKNKAIRWVWYTTALLVLVTVLSSLNVAYKWVFSTTVIGQAILIYTVYKVLTDNYTTDKTFKDGYEDYPINLDDD